MGTLLVRGWRVQRPQQHGPARRAFEIICAIGQGYYVKSSCELERIENVDTQIGDVGGVACHQCHAMDFGGCRRVSALLLALDLDVFATLDLVLDVLVLAMAFPLDLALAVVVTLVMDLRLALAIRPS